MATNGIYNFLKSQVLNFGGQSKFHSSSNGHLSINSSSATVVWTTVSAHRMQKSLSLPTFKRKQLRHEPYPSQPPPPLGTSFLPLSRTDTQSVFFVQSQDTFIQHCVRPTSTPTTPAVPFPFFFLHSSVICCPGSAHWSSIQPLMWVQAHTYKTCPCYRGLLEMFLLSFQLLVICVVWSCWSWSSW